MILLNDEPSRKINLLLFDFDGTLADTMHILLDIYNSVIAPIYKSKLIDPAIIQKLMSESGIKLLPEYNVNPLKIPFMVSRARKELAQRMDEVRPHKGIIETIHSLKNLGYSCGIATSNSRSNVNSFLEKNKIADCFDYIYTGKDLFGKSAMLRRMIKEHKIDPKVTAYIGDEIRDIEAGKSVNFFTIAVTWGFNNEDILLKASPNLILKESKELLNYFKSNTHK